MNLIKYQNPVLVSSYGGVPAKDCIIEESFSPLMDTLCNYALQNSLGLFINSSDRSSAIVPGAIVPPAQMSNHMIGHAIDCDIIETGVFWNSTKLNVTDTELSPGILAFINLVRKHPVLRWGGDFAPIGDKRRDVVHFDDGLNIRHPELWHQLYNSQTAPICNS